MSADDLLDRIDAVTAAVCARCGGRLDGSPSDDFCDAECQQAWTEHHNAVTELVGYQESCWAATEHRAQMIAIYETVAPAAAWFAEQMRAAPARRTRRPPPPPPPEDRMAAALEARRNRNTGPQVLADPRRNRRR